MTMAKTQTWPKVTQFMDTSISLTTPGNYSSLGLSLQLGILESYKTPIYLCLPLSQSIKCKKFNIPVNLSY